MFRGQSRVLLISSDAASGGAFVFASMLIEQSLMIIRRCEDVRAEALTLW